MIDLSLTAGRLRIQITWKRPASPQATTPSPPVNTGYPMRVSTPTGFGRRTVRTDHEDEEQT